VQLYYIDDLQEQVMRNIKLREEDADMAKAIIRVRTDEFMDWVSTMHIGPAAGRLKELFNEIALNEMRRFLRRTDADEQKRKEFELAAVRIAGKLFHCAAGNLDGLVKKAGAETAEEFIRQMTGLAERMAKEDGGDGQ